ncbi:MAG TPA: PAS domain S-box protein [Candidatus Hydrogenedens sp.]|nr:PAS domain S-box protein [Candidatus Hydrogenedens sp.]
MSDSNIEPEKSETSYHRIKSKQQRDVTFSFDTTSIHAPCQYEYIFQTTPLTAIQGYYTDGKIFFWNKASEILYEYLDKDVIGKNIKDILLPAEEWQSFDETVQTTLKKGAPTELKKWSIQTRSGTTKYVLSTMVPSKIGDSDAIFCMDVDITELIETQNQLNESEQKYRNIVEHAQEGIWVVNEEFKTVFVNKKMADILGFTPEEMIGKSTLEFIPPEEHADTLLKREKRKKGEFDKYERSLICADKTKRIFLVTASPILDTTNKFKGAIGLFTDITERKILEETIKQERDRCIGFLNLSPSLFILLDSDGNIQHLNHSACQVLKCDTSAIGKNWFETFVSPEQRETLQKHFKEIITNKIISDIEDEVYIINSNNEEKILLLRHAFLYGENREINGLIYSGMDITEKIKDEKEQQILNEKLQQTQRLESIGILAGGIAHDFNNLLVGIIGNADLALMELPPDSETRYYLQEIIRISKQLTHLSQQLLAYAGKGKTFPRLISLSSLINSNEKLIEVSVSKKIAVKYDLDPKLPLIDADPAHIQQLLINLILNSAESIGDRPGIITIITRQMHCDKNYLKTTYFGENCKEGQYVYLEIIDNGEGIKKEIQERMFEPFFTTKFTGRGLGLSAVAGIVRSHNGAIRVYSEIGRGTSFKVFFPISENQVLQQQLNLTPTTETKHLITQKHILVVDDEKLVRDTVRNMLEISGYKVITAEDGLQAIQIYRDNQSQIDLVLLDMTMPQLDGEETFRELRRINPKVKVILSSGYNEKDVIERFVGKGLIGFIQKPYVLSTLLNTIHSTLEMV